MLICGIAFEKRGTMFFLNFNSKSRVKNLNKKQELTQPPLMK